MQVSQKDFHSKDIFWQRRHTARQSQPPGIAMVVAVGYKLLLEQLPSVKDRSLQLLAAAANGNDVLDLQTEEDRKKNIFRQLEQHFVLTRSPRLERGQLRKLSTISALLLLAPTFSDAHVPFVEDPEGDWSWAEPFDFPLGRGRKALEFVCDITAGECPSVFEEECANDSCVVAEEFQDDVQGQTFVLYDDDSDLAQSRIFFGNLYKQDTFDVLRFTVLPGQPQLVLALTPLTFNCEKLESFYPSIALIVPAGTGQGARNLTLAESTGPNMYPWAPFLPAGFEVIVVHQPREERAVFAASPNEGGGPGYLLPVGLDTECLQDQPPSCNFNNTISGIFLFVPSTEYRVVVWDTKKLKPNKSFPHDYAINFGAAENETPIEAGRIRFFQDSHIISLLVHAPGCDSS